MNYKFLSHTADVKFQATGNTLEELFSEAFLALMETVSGKITILNQTKKTISIKGDDLGNLMYKFLEEFLFMLDSEDFLAAKIESITINEKELSLVAEISGDKGEHYNFTNDVKAITYNEMFVKSENGKWVCQVVLDV